MSTSVAQYISVDLGITKGYVRKTLRVETYNALVNEYPGLKDPRLMRLFIWCIFGKREEYFGGVLVGAWYCNLAFTGRASNQESLPKLKALQAVLGIDNFKWSDFDRQKKQCREVAVLKLPEYIIKLLEAETMETGHEGSRAYLNGAPFKFSALKDAKLDGPLDAQLDFLKDGSQRKVLDYLNSLDRKYYIKIFKYNFQSAVDVARSLKKNVADTLCLLRALKDESKAPFYTLSENTYRVYPHGYSVVQLKREVRKALCKDWYEADLKNAQLAIIARLWGIPDLENFLMNGGSFWSHVLQALNLPLTSDNKDWLKQMTYALAFGAGINGFKDICKDHDFCFSYYKKFRAVPLIKSIFKARKKRLAYFKSCDGIHKDCFKLVTKVPIEECYKLLAREAQSVEWALMQSLFEYVWSCSPKEIAIVLFQHDGATLFIKQNAERHMKKINEALLAYTLPSKIQTYFEFEKL